MTGLVRPWLHRTHRNFFLAFTVTIIRFTWSAVIGFADPAAFTGPAYHDINLVASPQVWAIIYATIAAVMIVGLFQSTFTVARAGLLAGFAVAFFQLMLLAQAALDGAATGNGVANFFFIAGLILSQALEPPNNPATR